MIDMIFLFIELVTAKTDGFEHKFCMKFFSSFLTTAIQFIIPGIKNITIITAFPVSFLKLVNCM